MIESLNLPNIHTNGNNNKANDTLKNSNNNNNNNNNKNNNNNNNNDRLEFPFQIEPVDPIVNQDLLKDFTGERDGFVQVGPKKYLFPGTFKKHAEHFYNFKARQNDIWIATYPRSGTTWTQELVWMIANDLDYVTAQREFLTKRSPFFEFCVFMHDKTQQMFIDEHEGNSKNQDTIRNISVPGYEFLPNITDRRFIKTHLPFSLMPPSVMNEKAKIIYVARNPKDVIVSYYHLSRLYRTTGYVNDFETFWDHFENDLVAWSPYWEHIKEGWAHRQEPNVLFMFYEEMNQDLPATILKVAQFLGKPMDNDQVAKLANYLNIENFRNNPAVNQHELREIRILNSSEPSFVRNGKTTVKGWQKEYTPEIVERVEKWLAKTLADTTLRFPEFS